MVENAIVGFLLLVGFLTAFASARAAVAMFALVIGFGTLVSAVYWGQAEDWGQPLGPFGGGIGLFFGASIVLTVALGAVVGVIVRTAVRALRGSPPEPRIEP